MARALPVGRAARSACFTHADPLPSSIVGQIKAGESKKAGPRRGRRLGGVCALACLLLVAACASNANHKAPDKIDEAMLVRLGDDSLKSGDAATAASFYQRAHAMDPSKIEPLEKLAEVYVQTGHPKEASEAYEEAVQIEPNNPDLLRKLANLQLQTGDPAAAAASLRTAVAAHPDWKTQNSLGVAEDLLGDHKSAQEAYLAGLQLSPGNLQLMNNLGLSYVVSGDYPRGISALQQVANDPGSTQRMRLNLALAYGLAGDQDKAEQVAKANLDPAKVEQNLGYYEFLRLLHNPGAIAKMLGAHQVESVQQ